MNQLTLIDKAFLLKRTPLFGALDLDLLLAISDKLGLVAFKQGEFIFTAKEDANRMYFILKGAVAILLDENKEYCVLGNGEFFGEESLFNDMPRAYAAYCQTETHVLTLSRTNLYAIISECPSVALGFLKVYSAAIQFRPFKPLGGAE